MEAAKTMPMSASDGVASGYVPRRKNDPAAMRARILDAAYDLFQQQGYNASSVHEIAARAGVSGGAFHHHFPTKKALGLAVIQERVSPGVDKTWRQPLASSTDARAAIMKIFDGLASDLDRSGIVRGCPVNNLTLELSLADVEFRAALKRLFDQWRGWIATALGGSDSDMRAAMVVASFSGAMAIAKVEQRGEPLRLCGRELERLL
jgi:AcrR family transcriptional regulator